MDAEEEEDVEDGEINNGFLGEAEMENRKTLAAAYGDDVSWVEAVILGAKHLAPASNAAASEQGGDRRKGGDEEEEEEVSCYTLLVRPIRSITALLLSLPLQHQFNRSSVGPRFMRPENKRCKEWDDTTSCSAVFSLPTHTTMHHT